MVRILIIGGFVALLFWVFTIVDCAMQPASRHRGVSKPAWLVIVVLLPVLGGLLWFTVGRTRKSAVPPPRAPDDDPVFLGRIADISDQDERIRRLEEELAALDSEDDDPRWNLPHEQSAPDDEAEPPVHGAELPDDDDNRGHRGAVG